MFNQPFRDSFCVFYVNKYSDKRYHRLDRIDPMNRIDGNPSKHSRNSQHENTKTSKFKETRASTCIYLFIYIERERK